MHPKLIENPTFLSYYQKWQANPSSILFVPIAQFCLQYGLVQEAISICEEGLKENPELVSGLMTLASAYKTMNQPELARKCAMQVIHLVPNHTEAKEYLKLPDIKPDAKIKTKVVVKESPMKAWQTVTMAKVYESQGHVDQAAAIYRAILSKDPTNQSVKSALNTLLTPES